MGKMKLILELACHIRNVADTLEEIGNCISPQEKEEISLEEVRKVLAQKSQAGFTDKVRDIIEEFGCSKLSQIDKNDYEKILKKAKELGE